MPELGGRKVVLVCSVLDFYYSHELRVSTYTRNMRKDDNEKGLSHFTISSFSCTSNTNSPKALYYTELTSKSGKAKNLSVLLGHSLRFSEPFQCPHVTRRLDGTRASMAGRPDILLLRLTESSRKDPGNTEGERILNKTGGPWTNKENLLYGIWWKC
jgi:hypothetical protein